MQRLSIAISLIALVSIAGQCSDEQINRSLTVADYALTKVPAVLGILTDHGVINSPGDANEDDRHEIRDLLVDHFERNPELVDGTIQAILGRFGGNVMRGKAADPVREDLRKSLLEWHPQH